MKRSPRLEAAIVAGDDSTWSKDEWSWDSQEMVALPKRTSQPRAKDAAGTGSCSAFAQVAGEEFQDEGAGRSIPSRPSGDETGGTHAAAPGAGTPSRPGRTTATGKGHTGVVICQADGCGKELTRLTYYHQRNRVCDIHVKADSYSMNGDTVRFCQRCGRAHDLAEFDGKKHSCRKQLEKHNARRRKRQQAIAPAKLEAGLHSSGQSGENEVLTAEEDAALNFPFRISGQGRTTAIWGPQATMAPAVAHTVDVADNANIANELGSWLTDQLDSAGIDKFPEVILPDMPIAGPSRLPLLPDADAFDVTLAMMDAVGLPTSSSARPADTMEPSSAAANPTLTEQATIASISIKLFGCTPAELPADLRGQLLSWFDGHVAAMDGYLRPGCVHLTVDAFLVPDAPGNGEGAGTEPESTTHKRSQPEGGSDVVQDRATSRKGIAAVVERMLKSGEQLWRTRTLLVQSKAEIALVHNGALKQIWDAEAALMGGRVVPCVVDIHDAVILAGQSSAPTLTLRGVNLLQDDVEIVCRFNGEYVSVQHAQCSDCRCVAAARKRCHGDESSASTARNAEKFEQRCCGCCIGKLVAVSQEPSSAMAANSGCCSQKESKTSATAMALQSVRICLEKAPEKPGILHIDVIKGAYVAPRSARFLVVDDEDVRRELLALEPAILKEWTDALGIVLTFIGNKEKMMDWRSIERIAIPVLYFAVCKGLVALAKYLHAFILFGIITVAAELPARPQTSGLDGLAMLSTADQACKAAALRRITVMGQTMGTNDNLTLLHQAVRSQCVEMVRMVLQWGADAGMPWRADVQGLRGLSPLHLAAAARNPTTAASLVLTLLTSCPDGTAAWNQSQAEDSSTAADFAARLGRRGLLQAFGAPTTNKHERMEPKPSIVAKAPGVVEAPVTPRHCRCTGFCPCSRSAHPCAGCEASDDESGCCGSLTGKCICCSPGNVDGDQEHGGIAPSPAVHRPSCCSNH